MISAVDIDENFEPTASIPENDLSIPLARCTEQIWMCRIPSHKVHIIRVSSRECTSPSVFDLIHTSFIITLGPTESWRTDLSGNQTLVILSTPTAASFFPSQLQATWLIPKLEFTRISLGLKVGKSGAYGRLGYHWHTLLSGWKTWRTVMPRVANVLWAGGEGGRWIVGMSSSSLDAICWSLVMRVKHRVSSRHVLVTSCLLLSRFYIRRK